MPLQQHTTVQILKDTTKSVYLFACMPPLAAVVAAEPDRLRRQHRFAAQVAQASAAAAPHSLQIPPGVLLPAPALRPEAAAAAAANEARTQPQGKVQAQG